MTDRLFTDCCYGTEHQHGPNQGCPVEIAARYLCEDDGLDPDEHIVGGQATAFTDYGPRWQAQQRSEGQLGIRDYIADGQELLSL